MSNVDGPPGRADRSTTEIVPLVLPPAAAPPLLLLLMLEARVVEDEACLLLLLLEDATGVPSFISTAWLAKKSVCNR